MILPPQGSRPLSSSAMKRLCERLTAVGFLTGDNGFEEQHLLTLLLRFRSVHMEMEDRATVEDVKAFFEELIVQRDPLVFDLVFFGESHIGSFVKSLLASRV